MENKRAFFDAEGLLGFIAIYCGNCYRKTTDFHAIQNVVNDVLRHPNDKPTIGLLLVKGKDKTVVEYSLAGFTNPIGVADWRERLTKELPDELKSSLPTIEDIERELENGDSNLNSRML